VIACAILAFGDGFAVEQAHGFAAAASPARQIKVAADHRLVCPIGLGPQLSFSGISCKPASSRSLRCRIGSFAALCWHLCLKVPLLKVMALALA
jgi:hypothetical protein